MKRQRCWIWTWPCHVPEGSPRLTSDGQRPLGIYISTVLWKIPQRTNLVSQSWAKLDVAKTALKIRDRPEQGRCCACCRRNPRHNRGSSVDIGCRYRLLGFTSTRASRTNSVRRCTAARCLLGYWVSKVGSPDRLGLIAAATCTCMAAAASDKTLFSYRPPVCDQARLCDSRAVCSTGNGNSCSGSNVPWARPTVSLFLRSFVRSCVCPRFKRAGDRDK